MRDRFDFVCVHGVRVKRCGACVDLELESHDEVRRLTAELDALKASQRRVEVLTRKAIAIILAAKATTQEASHGETDDDDHG